MEENKEKTVKKRQECDPAYQWHIQDLYASDEAWEKDYESLTSEIQSPMDFLNARKLALGCTLL